MLFFTSLIIIVLLVALLIVIAIGVLIYEHTVTKYIGVYWGKMTVATRIGGVIVNSQEQRCCFKIYYHIKIKEYSVESITDHEGDEIRNLGHDYKLQKLKMCLKDDGKVPSDFLDKMRIAKLGL